MEAAILRKRKPDNTDYATGEMPQCPICGAKPYISKDIVNGFYFGWSVGCPRYYINDRVHGNPERPLTCFNLNSKKECIDWWKRRVKDEQAGNRAELTGMLNRLEGG